MEIVVSSGYRLYDQKLLTVGTSQVVFTTPTSSIMTKVDKIFVQSASTNTAPIVIGKTGVLSNLNNGGFELTAGANITLPMQDYANIYAISGSAGQKLLITYLAGVI